MYSNGRGVQQDEERAKEYFRRAASLGDPFGMSNLGCMHAHECALTEKSLDWCREEVADKFGIDWEMQLEENEISSHAFEMSGSSARSPYKTPAARKPGWLKQALREAEAALHISMQRAMQKDKLAAVQAHLQSLETSAAHHRAEAIRWFKKASDAGHVDSKTNLGIMLGETGDSEGTIDIMQQSLSLMSAPVLSEAKPSISIADIKPSMGYKPSHSLARAPVDSSCLGAASTESSLIASPHHHHSKHKEEYWRDPSIPKNQHRHEGLLLHQLGEIENSEQGMHLEKHTKHREQKKLSLAKSPPSAFFWGHTGDDSKSVSFSMHSRLLRPRSKLPPSMRHHEKGPVRRPRVATLFDQKRLKRPWLLDSKK